MFKRIWNLIHHHIDKELEILEHAYEEMPMEIALYDRSRKFLFLNRQFFTNGLNRDQFIGHDDQYYLDALNIKNDILKKRNEAFDKALLNKQAVRFTEKLVMPEANKTLFFKRTFQPLFLNGDQTVSHMALFGSNMTAVILSQQELKYLAFHDKLTGLMNRDAFNQQLDQLIAESPRWPGDQIAGILFCDLDNFKLVNDSLGHDVGDLLLKEVSMRIASCLRQSDSIFRLGGDEFTILLRNLKQDIDAGMVAEKLIKEISRPYQINEHSITYVTLSIGIGLFPKDGKERETIVSNADMAMYEAKRNSKNNYKFFSKDLTQTSKERLKIVKGLKELISKKDFSNQFNMVYQPIFSNTQNNDFSIVGSEALLRWNHPLHGNIPPDLFIPIAEESNLIQHFGDWIFQQSLTDFKLLNALHPDASFYISINLSAKQLDAPQIVSDIEQAVQKALLLPKQIQIEITETGIIKDSNLAFKNLYQLAEMGFRLAIDDFGVGFASLSYLQKIPASVIKIDKTFIQQSLTSSKNRDLVKAIIMMGQNLKKEVIAEGVEEKKHLSFLMEHNCFTYQGYYFSKPLPFAEMKQLLNKKR